jgi:hypothetical protein
VINARQGAGIGTGSTAVTVSTQSIAIEGGTFDITVTEGAGIGIGRVNGGTTTMEAVQIKGGEFTVLGDTGVGIGSGCPAGGTSTATITSLTISGGSFHITQNLGPAIGSGYVLSSGGTSSGGTSKIGTLTISGGTFHATTKGDTDPVIGSGAVQVVTGSLSQVSSIAITGGDFDLTARVFAAPTYGNLPAAIGYPNTGIGNDIHITSITIRDAKFKVYATYFVDGLNSEQYVDLVSFAGTVVLEISGPTASAGESGLIFAKAISIDRGSTFSAKSPVQVFTASKLAITTGSAALPTIDVVYTGNRAAAESISGIDHAVITFADTTLTSAKFDLVLRPTNPSDWAAWSHEVVVDRTESKCLFLSIPRSQTSYQFFYYVWATGATGLLCAPTDNQGASTTFTFGGGVNTRTVTTTCHGVTMVATKTTLPQTVTLSPRPTISRLSLEFTTIRSPYTADDASG